MNFLFPLAAVMVSLNGMAPGELETRVVEYELDGTTFESTVVFEKDQPGLRPGVLMVPNWMGPTEASLKKAGEIARMGYLVMMVDMYGVGVRPQNASEAGAAAGAVRADRALMRARAGKALEVLRGMEGIPLDTARMAGIGFCFGGGTVLELARAGADLDAVVSFHGDLMSPTLEGDAKNVAAKVLVLHGADDPYVPQEHVQTFIKVMQGTSADWQLVQYSGAVHSFTDPLASNPGAAMYHPVVAKRAFAAMKQLFDELWQGPAVGSPQ